MIRYTINRIFYLIPFLFILSVATFFVSRPNPGK